MLTNLRAVASTTAHHATADPYEQLEHFVQTTSKDASVIGKAQDLVDRMAAEKENPLPLSVYQQLISVFAYSKDTSGGDLAEAWLQKLQESQDISIPSEIYALVMQAWIVRRNLTRVQAIFDSVPNPDTTLYNKLLKAYCMLPADNETKQNIDKATDLFERLVAEKMDNEKTWVHILRAHGSQKDDPNSVPTTKSLIERMRQRFQDDSSVSYVRATNALLRAMSRQRGLSRECETILFDLLSESQSNPLQYPDAETFYHVISSFRWEPSRQGVALKVETHLQLQRATLESSPYQPKAFSAMEQTRIYHIRTIQTAISILSRTRDPNKAIKVQNLFEQLDREEWSLSTCKDVIRACGGNVQSLDAEQRRTAWNMVLDVWRHHQKAHSKNFPDSVVVALLIQAAGVLLPEGSARDAAVEKLFVKTCQEGKVNPFVLSSFARVVSDAVELRLLGGFVADRPTLPAEWSRNLSAK